MQDVNVHELTLGLPGPYNPTFSRTLFVFFPTFCRFESNTTPAWLDCMVKIASQKLRYFQLLLNIEKSGEEDYKRT